MVAVKTEPSGRAAKERILTRWGLPRVEIRPFSCSGTAYLRDILTGVSPPPPESMTVNDFHPLTRRPP